MKRKKKVLSAAPDIPIEFNDEDEALNQNVKVKKGYKHRCENCFLSNCNCGSFDPRICRICAPCQGTASYHGRYDVDLQNIDKSFSLFGDQEYVPTQEKI